MSIFTTKFLQWAMVIAYIVTAAGASLCAGCIVLWAGFATAALFALAAFVAAAILFAHLVHGIE